LEHKPLIELKNVSVQLRQRTVLDNINLTLRSNEIVTLIGPNGAGKSTLMKVILGLITPSSGERIKHGKYSVGYVPQKLSIDPTLPLNVDRFLSLAGPFDPSQRLEALRQVNAHHLTRSPMLALSGGEFQRVLLARALLRKPKLLALDEPSQGMDITGQGELFNLIKEIRSELNCCVLMVSHDLHLVMSGTDKVICLNQHICCSGLPDTVSTHPEYLQLFGKSEADNLALYTHHHDHTHPWTQPASSNGSSDTSNPPPKEAHDV